MNCPECGVKTKKSKADNYQYLESGLKNVYLSKMNVWVCEACGNEEVEIPHIEVLHREIALLLVTKKGKLNTSEFRFLRTYLGLSGKDFALRSGVSPETVSRWENGKIQIPVSIDGLLRHMSVLNKKNHDYSVENLTEILASRRTLKKIRLNHRSSGWKVHKVA